MINTHLKIVKDTFLEHFPISFSDGNLYETALKFPSQKLLIFMLFMLIGFISVNFINYSIGYLLRCSKYCKQNPNSFIDKFHEYYIPIVIISSPIHYLGAVVILFYGFTKFSFFRVIIYGCVGKLIYSLIKILYFMI